MYRKYGLLLLALLGVCAGVFGVIRSSRKLAPPPILFQPPVSPYRFYIGAEGMVEASTDNIAIATPYNEIVTDVFVTVGQFVKEGDPLFALNIETKEDELYQAQVDKAYNEVQFENQKAQLALYDRLTDRRAVSENEYNQAFYAAESAQVAIAQAEARILTAQTMISRSIVRAPFDGQVLQVTIHKGEVANLNPYNQEPLITFGPVCPSHLRISIDEEDAWRYRKGAPATAFVRGNSSISFPLQFVRIEPLMIPKQSLTGSSTERVDTRVLQVIYTFACDHLPVYNGQILDVFIDSIPADTRYPRDLP